MSEQKELNNFGNLLAEMNQTLYNIQKSLQAISYNIGWIGRYFEEKGREEFD